MKFEDLLRLVSNEPLFETGLLLAGDVTPAGIQKQLSRWVATGRLYQLRRGLYCLAPPFQKISPHPFVVANYMRPASYVSLQSALAFYGLIPEYVPVTTSVTTLRPGQWQTPLGHYHFQHIKVDWFIAYRRLEVQPSQRAYLATPEKALLDLIYLHPAGDSLPYLQNLRLQNLTQLNFELLTQLAQTRPKLRRAIQQINRLAQEDLAYEPL